jgi:hypothetical protein
MDRRLAKGSYLQNKFSSGFEDFAYKATVGLRVAHPIGWQQLSKLYN